MEPERAVVFLLGVAALLVVWVEATRMLLRGRRLRQTRIAQLEAELAALDYVPPPV